MPSQSEIREQITQKIVEALQKGTAPWRRPWSVDRQNAGHPANVVSKRSYRGVNVLLLGLSGYESRWWATFPQWQALGGRVKKGERSTRIVYWRQVERLRVGADGGRVVETFPLIRTYCVFNAAQVEGEAVEKYCTATAGPVQPSFVDYTPAEAVIAATDACIEFGGNRAVYYPTDDCIRLPVKESFESQKEYYSTALHELAHWTGHESRLDRLVKNARFRSAEYAFEELVAEIGSSFLCCEIGIPQSDDLSNQAAYLASWLKVLQNDSSAIFTASSQASAACDFILAFSRPEDGADEECEAAGAVA